MSRSGELSLKSFTSPEYSRTFRSQLFIEWASAQVPPTPLYLGGTVGRERERDREGEGEGERGIDRWMGGWMDGWTDR